MRGHISQALSNTYTNKKALLYTTRSGCVDHNIFVLKPCIVECIVECIYLRLENLMLPTNKLDLVVICMWREREGSFPVSEDLSLTLVLKDRKKPSGSVIDFLNFPHTYHVCINN